MFSIISYKECDRMMHDNYVRVKGFENEAAAYRLHDGRYIILPPSMGDSCLLFETEAVYNSFVLHPQFFVNHGYFLDHTEQLKNVADSIDFFYHSMRRILSTPVKKIESDEDLSGFCQQLTKYLKSHKFADKNAEDEFYINCLALIGQYMTIHYGCIFIYSEYSWNFTYYYMPYVGFEKYWLDQPSENIIIVHSVIKDMIKKKKFNYDFLKREMEIYYLNYVENRSFMMPVIMGRDSSINRLPSSLASS